MWETKRVTILPPTAWHRKLERWLGLSSKWSQPATAYQPHSPSPLSSSVKWSRKWVPLQRSLRRSNKRMLTGADTQCAHKCCLLSVFGIACFIETSRPLSSGLFYSSLNLPLCSDLSSTQYFFFPTQFSAIGSTAFQITLNYPPVSVDFERFRFSYKSCTKPPFWSWFFQLLNHFYWPLLPTRLAKALW